MMGAFLAGPVGSWLRVFVATALTAFLADLAEGSGWVFDWTAYLLAAVVALLPIVIAYLNTADPRFGKGSG